MNANDVRNAVSTETTNALAGLVDQQCYMAADWFNHANWLVENAEKNALKAKTPKIRKQWQQRQAAAERARVLIGATLASAMHTVGSAAADVIEKEFTDPFARALAGELREYAPLDRAS